MILARAAYIAAGVVLTPVVAALSAQTDSSRPLVRTAAASAPQLQRFVGVVFDSLTNRPLPGARVSLDGTPSEGTTSDSLGRFDLRADTSGAHLLVVTHPALDSVGLARIARPISPATSPLVLAVPSYATLRAAACGTGKSSDGDGLIYGVVRSASSLERVRAARVTASWVDLNAKSTTYLQPVAVHVAASDSGEWYACGVPRDAELTVSADSGDARSGDVVVLVGDRRILRTDLVIAPPTVAVLPMVVEVTRPDGSPLPQARVRVDDAAEVRTDAAGRAVARVPAAGTRDLQVLALGFQPRQLAVDVLVGDTTRVTVRMSSSVTTLATVNVRASRVSREIERRDMLGTSYTINAQQLEKEQSWSTLLTHIHAPMITANRGSPVVLFRNAFANFTNARFCPAGWYLDGRQSMPDEVISYPPEELYAVESIPSSVNVPARYVDLRTTCGVIMVWTKDYMGVRNQRRSP